MFDTQMAINSKSSVDTYLNHVNKESVKIPLPPPIEDDMIIQKSETSEVRIQENGIKFNFWKEFFINFGNGAPGRII